MNNLKAIFLLTFCGYSFFTQAQDNLTYVPQQPKPGDVVNISYTPPATVFAATDVINCVAYKWGAYCDDRIESKFNPCKPVNVLLKKKGNHYEGAVQTDSLTRMLALNFTSGNVEWKIEGSKFYVEGGKVDSNQNKGYCIPFFNNDGELCQYTNFLTGMYLSSGKPNSLGIFNIPKTIEFYSKELDLFPDAKYYALSNLLFFCSRYGQADKGKSLMEKQRELLYGSGLKSYKDMALLSIIASVEGSGNQGGYYYNRAVEKLKSEKGISFWLNNYEEEKNLAKKEAMLNEIGRVYESMGFGERMQNMIYGAYLFRYLFMASAATTPDATVFAKYADKFNFFTGKRYADDLECSLIDDVLDSFKVYNPAYVEKFLQERVALYSNMASKLQSGTPLPPTVGSDYHTAEENTNNIFLTATILSNKAAELYVTKGDDKTAWKYAKDAEKYMHMLTGKFGAAYEINTTYTLLSEKFLPPKRYKPEIEKMVRDGAWKPEMLEVLKRLWVKEKGSTNGFEEYTTSLRSSKLEEAKKTLLATQLNYAAPLFTLKDLDGNTIKLEDLKGKTVILDFWATWCGPCKASFPGMQKLVTAYKDDANVKFLFIDTWEDSHTDTKKSDAEIAKNVADYIKEKKYSFQVLLDNETKAGKAYKAFSVPAKFIIDKNGIVRYNILGFEADEGKLFDEIKTMIESVK